MSLALHNIAIFRPGEALALAGPAGVQAPAALPTLILDTLPDGVLAIDRGWRINFVNEAAARRFGKPREELLGECLWHAFPRDGIRELYARYERAMSSGTPTEFEARSPFTGTPIGVRASPIEGGLLIFLRDLSREKAANARGDRAEAHYLRLTGASPFGIFVIDAVSIVREANDAFAAITGRPRAELLGRPMEEMLSPRDHAHLAERRRRRAQGESGLFDFECTFRRPDGEERLARVITTPITEAGAFAGVHGMVLDITEERSALEWQRRFAAVLEASTDYISIRDLEGNPLYLNRAGRRMIGHPDEENAGYAIETVFPAAERDRMRQEAIPTAIRTGSWQDETVLLHADGSGIPVLKLLLALRGGAGEVEYLATIARDITNLKRVEAELRSSEEKLRAMFEQTVVGVALVDAAGRAVEVNPALASMLGYAPADLAELTFDDLLHPADLASAWTRFVGLRSGVSTRYSHEVRYLRRDGSTMWAEVNASLLSGADRETSPAILVVEDIGDRKRAEEELRRKEEQLHQAQKMEAIGRLAGGVAHDFNNLLTVITGHAQLLASELGPDDPHRADVLKIRGAAERSAALTQQLLAFSRKQRHQPESVDLNEVIGGVESLVQRMLGADVRLRVDAPHGLWRVSGNASQLEQTVMNLLINARDAMPAGGDIDVRATNVPAPDGDPGGRRVLLSVTDTGCGMDAATQARIFEPFYTTKPQGKGTGLGLATTYGIVTRSGGTVEVESAVGAGTTFRIHLPVSEGPAPGVTADEPHEGDEIAGGTETVLVVEDDDEVRPLLVEILRRRGYRVLLARNGAEGLTLCELSAGSIDLLLTDVVMPQMSGPELVQRARELRADLPVLFISGFADDAVAVTAIPDDARILEKPFRPDTLLRAVRAALDR